MKKIFLSLVILINFLTAFSQSGEFGPFLGISSYIGEVNQTKLFYMPSPAYGVVFRHNFHERFTLRLETMHTNLRGDDMNSDNNYQILRNQQFKTSLTDLSAGIEVNFLPYDKEKQKTKYFTPFVYTGISFLVIPEYKKGFSFAVPFTVGFKYALTSKISLGAEWSIRKTFTDYIDKLEDHVISPLLSKQENKQLSYNPNNDWFTYTGILLTITVFSQETQCPAYF